MARIRDIKTPDEFDMLVDLYRADCVANDDPLSVVGLALFMGFSSKQTIYNYKEHEDGLFKDSVDRALSMVEKQHYDKVVKGECHQGNTFLLRSVYGYQDKQVIQVEPMKVEINGLDAEL
jgi:hypothetical protein